MGGITILWRTEDGEEHEERWPSVEQFRTWAQGECMTVSYTAYEDDDGEQIVVDKGEL